MDAILASHTNIDCERRVFAKNVVPIVVTKHWGGNVEKASDGIMETAYDRIPYLLRSVFAVQKIHDAFKASGVHTHIMQLVKANQFQGFNQILVSSHTKLDDLESIVGLVRRFLDCRMVHEL